MPTYAQAAKDEGFGLYCRGLSLRKVWETMKGKHPTLSRGTVAKWADADDWRRRRDLVRAEARDLVDQQQAETQARLVKKIDQAIEQAFEDLGLDEEGNRKLAWKSREGAVYGLGALVKTRERLIARPEPNLPDNLGVKRVVTTLFRIILKHPVLGPVMEMHQQEIVELIGQELEAG